MQKEYFVRFHQHVVTVVKVLKNPIQHFKMEQHKLVNSSKKITKIKKKIMIKFLKLMLKSGGIQL